MEVWDTWAKPVTDNDLKEELAFYAEKKAELLKTYEGKYALIKGRALLGVFDSPSAAYEEGVKRVGNVPMLIVRVQKEEPRAWIPALQLGLIRAHLQG